jgi:hypothetical protein
MTVTAIDVHNPENRIDDARILAVYWRDDPKPSYHAVPVTDADRYVRMWEQHAETVTHTAITPFRSSLGSASD